MSILGNMEKYPLCAQCLDEQQTCYEGKLKFGTELTILGEKIISVPKGQ